jgi:hypothetical protein
MLIEQKTPAVVKPQAALVSVESDRAIQEVQALVVAAKKYPRNEAAAIERMLKACERRTLADQALYAYERGDSMVEGPSIRLAEMMAQNWGNLDYGIKELEQKDGESVMMAYAWDTETNVRQTKTFTVKHARYSKAKGLSALGDPRDIYENNANNGARRLRACILGVIPGDIVDSCVDACKKTMKSKGPVKDQIRLMLESFAEFGVTAADIQAFLGCEPEKATQMQITKLRGIYNSIRDGMSKPEVFFKKKAAAPEKDELFGEES